MFTDEKMTPDELISFLGGVRGATHVTLVTETEPPCYAGSPKITKLSEVNGTLNADYEKSVNRQLGREGKDANFAAGKLPWGVKVSKTCLIVKPGDDGNKTYVRIQIQDSKEPKFFLCGEPVPRKAVESFLRPSRKPSNQGTDKSIRPRTYEVTPGNCRIKAIAIKGRAIQISQEK